MAKRKTVRMLVEVSIPADQTAAFARREVRHLISVEGNAGYFTNAGDVEGVKVRKVSPAGRAS